MCGSGPAWRSCTSRARCGAIGTSNFLPHHLNNLAAHGGLRPMVDQLEFHPGYAQAAAVCSTARTTTSRWRPGPPWGRRRILEDPQLREMAAVASGHCAPDLPELRPAERRAPPAQVLKSRADAGRIWRRSRFSLTEEELWQLRTMPQVGWSGEHPDRERVRI